MEFIERQPSFRQVLAMQLAQRARTWFDAAPMRQRSPLLEAARRLEITESTVKVHMKSLLRKINAANRTQAAIWGMEAGFGGAEDAPPPDNGALD